jgi:hypothetical protein
LRIGHVAPPQSQGLATGRSDLAKASLDGSHRPSRNRRSGCKLPSVYDQGCRE